MLGVGCSVFGLRSSVFGIRCWMNMDFSDFQSDLRRLASLFDGGGAIHCARAPGRLDVMGGIGDYSGSVVLEKTLEESTWVAVQVGKSPTIRIESVAQAQPRSGYSVEIPVDRLFSSRRLRSFDQVREAFGEERWAGYIAGCVCILADEGLIESPPGLNILAASDVPAGAGVSSSAALEVASMRALCSLLGIDLDGLRLARLCQRVENEIVGAPCGIMDQVTSALGQQNSLLALECRPHNVLGNLAIPAGWRFVGLNSHVKHSVGGSAYTDARVAAFMGLAILRKVLPGRKLGYLCELTPEEWSGLSDRVPEELAGRAFLAEHAELPDRVTSVVPDTTYFVRACTEHPILENARVRRFMELMQVDDGPAIPRRIEAGRLMLESHGSYSDRVKLGSPETDLLVRLAMEIGPDGGVYGAKITGGGSGGTVAVLCDGGEADGAIAVVRKGYQAHTGVVPQMFSGSSPGAALSDSNVISNL